MSIFHTHYCVCAFFDVLLQPKFRNMANWRMKAYRTPEVEVLPLVGLAALCLNIGGSGDDPEKARAPQRVPDRAPAF